MARGPKPKAKHLKLVSGKNGKAEKSHQTKPPAPPQYLDANAKREWNRIIPLLVERGKYMSLFRTEFARYCVAFSRYRDAEVKLKISGVIVKSPKGYPIQNPYLAISNRAQETMAKLAAVFGLTMADYIRIQGGQLDLFDDRPTAKVAVGGNPWDEL